MTTFLLIRHAVTEAPTNLLTGRMPGVHLSASGTRSARRLARQLAECALGGIWSSPLERAVETATPLVNATKAPFYPCDKLNEVDYGDWTGLTFDALATDPRWWDYNICREATRIPSGETISEVRARVLSLLNHLTVKYPFSTIALVTHAELIRVALCYYLGMPDNSHALLDVAPSSVSIIRPGQQPTLLGINCEGTLARRFQL